MTDDQCTGVRSRNQRDMNSERAHILFLLVIIRGTIRDNIPN